MLGLLRGRWLWCYSRHGVGWGQGEADVSGVGCDVTMGARVPGFGAPEPLPGVIWGRRMQRWGRFRHHTVATARKASLKQRRGRMVQNSTRLGRAPCWVCCCGRLRHTDGGPVGPSRWACHHPHGPWRCCTPRALSAALPARFAGLGRAAAERSWPSRRPPHTHGPALRRSSCLASDRAHGIHLWPTCASQRRA